MWRAWLWKNKCNIPNYSIHHISSSLKPDRCPEWNEACNSAHYWLRGVSMNLTNSHVSQQEAEDARCRRGIYTLPSSLQCSVITFLKTMHITVGFRMRTHSFWRKQCRQNRCHKLLHPLTTLTYPKSRIRKPTGNWKTKKKSDMNNLPAQHGLG